ncbi:hypothetical protein ACWXVJ_01140 [Mycoplasma sp. 773]
MGASKKSTVIKNIAPFLNEHGIKIIDKRLTDTSIFLNYMNDLKKNGYKTKKYFSSID